MKVSRSCLLLLPLLVFCPAGAEPFDSLWVSYSNNTPGQFASYGPQRVMRINPGDFGLVYPIEIDSLMVEFYDGMGSWTDSVYIWRIYAGDGSTVLYESESLTAPRSLWARYALASTVQIDSGSFYIGMTHRLYQSPFAYPFIMTDNHSGTTHCFYGSPGTWQAWDVGEYFFYVFICPCQVGVEENPAPSVPATAQQSVVGNGFWLSGTTPARLLDASGRNAATLQPGANDLRQLEPGAYFLLRPASGAQKLIIQR